MTTQEDLHFMNEAIKEARLGAQQGGIRIGSVLVIDNKVVGRGHNQRIQQGDPILHGGMACLKNAGRLSAALTMPMRPFIQHFRLATCVRGLFYCIKSPEW